MEKYLTFTLEELSILGFWGTRAPLYMDMIVSFLAILPILSGISIFWAIKGQLKLHQISQFSLFFLTLIALTSFAYIVHYQKGFEALVQESSIGSSTALLLLVIHIIISVTTLTLWLFTLLYALSDKKRRALPGLYSSTHKQSGKRVFNGVLLISLSSIGIYWVLFIA